MTDRLDRFETQLTAAVARRTRTSRRRRAACVVTTAAVTMTAVAGATREPLDPLGLFEAAPSMRTEGPMRPTTAARLQLQSPPDDVARWSIAIYPANGALCGGVATDASPRPSIACQGAFPIAEQLMGRSVRVLPSTTVLGPSGGGRIHVLVSGFADGDVGDLEVRAGGRTVGTLPVTDTSIPLRVDRDDPALTPEGRRVAASLPGKLDLRLIAGAVTVSRAEARALIVRDATGHEVAVTSFSQ